jgi:hypothetical protein
LPDEPIIEDTDPHDPLRLTPGEFQDLCVLLAHAEDGGVVAVHTKDGGLDARLPSEDGEGTKRGWQAKRYSGSINWDECQKSASRAISVWQTPHMTFCFARDLSAKEQKTFAEKLVKEYPSVKFDFWSATELKRRMQSTDEGRLARDYLFDDPDASRKEMQRAYEVGGELNSVAQAAARLGVVRRFLQDPHFHYATSVSESGQPSTAPPTATVMSIEFEEEGQRVRLDATERYDGAAAKHGPVGAFVFEAGEKGRAAREKLERIFREGGTAFISEGIGVRMERVPGRFEAFFGNDVVKGEITIIGPPPPFLPVLVAVPGRELALELKPVAPPAGWDQVFEGSRGGLTISAPVRRRDGKLETQMTWKHTLGVGRATDQLLSLAVLTAGLEGQPVRLLRAEDHAELINSRMDRTNDESELKSLQTLMRLLGFVIEIEAWSGQNIEPPALWSEHDVEAALEAVNMIRQPVRDDASGVRAEMVYKPEALPEDPDEPHAFALVQELELPIFGKRVPLGRRLIHVPRGRLVDVDRSKHTAVMTQMEGEGATVRLEPPHREEPRQPKA